MFYPNLCKGCKTPLTTGQETLCTACRIQLPYIVYESGTDNVVTRTFRGRLQLDFALSLFYYQKHSIVQEILHELKYKGSMEIGQCFGKELTLLLEKQLVLNNFEAIIPVPMHHSKLKERGYNQAEIIATEIAQQTGKPLLNHILKKESTASSQTKKGRFERWRNSSEMFVCNETVSLKSVLLIDDVITSGATIEACVNALKKNNPELITSVASLAFTYR